MINRNKNNLNKYPHPQSPQLNSMTAEQKDYYFKKLLREEPHKEKHLHLACVTYMRDHYPEVVINHTRNQISAHSQVQANIYGYCKGFPDLFIAKKIISTVAYLWNSKHRVLNIVFPLIKNTCIRCWKNKII